MLSSAVGRSVYRSDWVVVTRLYRGPMLCIIMIFMLGLNVRLAANQSDHFRVLQQF